MDIVVQLILNALVVSVQMILVRTIYQIVIILNRVGIVTNILVVVALIVIHIIV